MNKLEFSELLFFFRSVRIPAKIFCGKTKLKGSHFFFDHEWKTSCLRQNTFRPHCPKSFNSPRTYAMVSRQCS